MKKSLVENFIFVQYKHIQPKAKKQPYQDSYEQSCIVRQVSFKRHGNLDLSCLWFTKKHIITNKSCFVKFSGL